MSRIFKSAYQSNSNKDKAPTFPYIVYRLRGTTYVPHYNHEVYVGPGYDKTGQSYTAEELISAGATPAKQMLWKRNKIPQFL